MNSIKADPNYYTHEAPWYRPKHVRLLDGLFNIGIYRDAEYCNGKVVRDETPIPEGYIKSTAAAILVERTLQSLTSAAFSKRLHPVKINNKNYYSLTELCEYSKIARAKIKGGQNESI